MTVTFSQTSNVPYDRHNYEIVLKNGKTVFFNNWEDTHAYWWMNCKIPDFLNVVIVKDKKKTKSKGFSQ